MSQLRPILAFIAAISAWPSSEVFAGDQSQELKLVTPEERVAHGALWAMRVDINPAFETPLTFLVESTQESTRITVYRFISRDRKAADVDLHYSLTIESMPLPEWLFKLDAHGGSHGLDGVDVGMHIAAGKKSHSVERWSPEDEAKDRGLEEYVSLINSLIDRTGVKPRHMLERVMLDDSVEFSIPVPPAFMAAAARFEEQHHESVGVALEKSFRRTGRDSTIALDTRRKLVHGKGSQRAAVDLTALIGSFTRASERYIVKSIDDLVAATSIEDDDPFGIATPTQRQDDGEQSGADQPATMPADKPSVKDEPSTPTSKDGPR